MISIQYPWFLCRPLARNWKHWFNSRWHISTNANTSKIFWPQLFIGSGCSPMKTGFRGTQLGHPRPPWGGLGGPESQKWAIWGANENKLSWLFFIRNEILSLAPNYTSGPVKILVKKDFWSGSFPVRQAKKTPFFTGVSPSGQKFSGRVRFWVYHPEPLNNDRGKHRNRYGAARNDFRGVLSNLILGIFSFSIFFNFLLTTDISDILMNIITFHKNFFEPKIFWIGAIFDPS